MYPSLNEPPPRKIVTCQSCSQVRSRLPYADSYLIEGRTAEGDGAEGALRSALARGRHVGRFLSLEWQPLYTPGPARCLIPPVSKLTQGQ